jgi:hypothetical protein
MESFDNRFTSQVDFKLNELHIKQRGLQNSPHVLYKTPHTCYTQAQISVDYSLFQSYIFQAALLKSDKQVNLYIYC